MCGDLHVCVWWASGDFVEGSGRKEKVRGHVEWRAWNVITCIYATHTYLHMAWGWATGIMGGGQGICYVRYTHDMRVEKEDDGVDDVGTGREGGGRGGDGMRGDGMENFRGGICGSIDC